MESVLTNDEVQAYYIKSELGRIIGIDSLDRQAADLVNGNIERFLQETNGSQMKSLAVWLSQSYRDNAVHRLLRNSDWKLVVARIDQITLSRINPAVNEVLSRTEIDWRLQNFVRYLNSYFTSHPQSDPESLREFRNIRPVYYRELIGVERERDVLLIDGAHRAVSLGLQGVEVFKIYVTSRL